ncbi:MAG: Carboxylic ester hydrolase [Cryobacterium sp.]|nr:Carboxylic ester hydrolase [Cryobacterium sp.]
MSSRDDEVMARTEGGVIKGVLSQGARVFRGIPYAADPVGSLRFAPPQRHPGWDGPLDASRAGPAVPQAISRLERVMGVSPASQGEENSLTVNVFAPTTSGPHPVLVWIHGGGFSSGSGGWPWYDAAEFAARHDIVVATINYRLGALGFLYLPWLSDDFGEGNFGMLDQVAALQWVERNISEFGGDPGHLTVGGQSAGAMSAQALASNPATRSLVHGVILQSPPASTMIQSRELATQRAQGFLGMLALGPNEARATLRDLPISVIIDAQSRLAAATGEFGAISPAMAPVVDPALGLVDEAGGMVSLSADNDIPVLVGTTRDETAAFFARSGAGIGPEPARIQSWLSDNFGPELDRAVARYRSEGCVSPTDVFVAATTEKEFRSVALNLASARSDRGKPTWVYQFDWRPTDSTFGACHCIDLPFLFGAAGAYANAAMLGGEDAPETVKVAFQAALAGFVRSGEPASHSVASWPSFHHDRAVLHFDLPEHEVAGASLSKMLIGRASE